MLEEEKDEDLDEIEEKELMAGKQKIKEEDSKKDGDEAKKSDIKINQKTDNVVNASIEGDTKVHNEVPVGAKSDANNEEEEIHKDSANMNVELQSNMLAPDKSIDNFVEMKAKICARNEQISAGPHHEQQRDLMFVGNGRVKCERDVDDSEEVKIEENTKEVSMFAEQRQTFMFDDPSDGGESGTEEEQSAFTKEVENLYRDKSLEFKAPKFHGEPLNLLKLWRAVIKLGGYDKVTTCKFWRQVGESFNPPNYSCRTCTTVSWTFPIFYEKRYPKRSRKLGFGGTVTIITLEYMTIDQIVEYYDHRVPGSWVNDLKTLRIALCVRPMKGYPHQLVWLVNNSSYLRLPREFSCEGFYLPSEFDDAPASAPAPVLTPAPEPMHFDEAPGPSQPIYSVYADSSSYGAGTSS